MALGTAKCLVPICTREFVKFGVPGPPSGPLHRGPSWVRSVLCLLEFYLCEFVAQAYLGGSPGSALLCIEVLLSLGETPDFCKFVALARQGGPLGGPLGPSVLCL